MLPTTPRIVTPRIRSFCSRIVPGGKLNYIPVAPVAHAEPKDCFATVERHVQNYGGTTVYGWQISEWPRAFIEAEFHAVWQDEGGFLHDVTPRHFPIERSLFLADPVRVYEGRQVNNIREPLSDLPAIFDYIAACDAEYEFLNRGDRADQHGEIVIEGAEEKEYRRIVFGRLSAGARLPQLGRNDGCPCGSGRKLKNCHPALIDVRFPPLFDSE